jgi:putative acyl-CoA dehydrogenase
MSAPMSDAFLVLAQAPGGLSCFLLPRFLPDGSVNALRLQRLKDKLGNRSNASSEVEFHRTSAWLIGEEGRGVANIIEMVTCTRLDCAVASAGQMRLALALALHHCRHRRVFQKHLVDQPLMAAVLADMALDVEAATALAFRLAGAFDRAAGDEREAAWCRVMTPVTKYWVCKLAPALGYEAMECLGGNGYVEEGLAARLYRELPLNAIWEGSGNVMCLDLLRVLAQGPAAVESVLAELDDAAAGERRLEAALRELRSLLGDPASLERQARHLVETLARTAAAVLLRAHAPAAVADAFIAGRLDGGFRHTYGAGAAVADGRAILERALPA